MSTVTNNQRQVGATPSLKVCFCLLGKVGSRALNSVLDCDAFGSLIVHVLHSAV